MKKLTILFGLLSIVLLFSACSTQSSLTDTKWQLTSLPGQALLTEVDVTINFSKDAIGGSDGCNTFGGSYQATNDTISFGDDIFSTMMYCSDEIDKQTQAFYKTLTEAAAYKITDSTLSLFDANEIELAEFTAIQN